MTENLQVQLITLCHVQNDPLSRQIWNHVAVCLILPTLETILKPTCCFKLNSPGFRWGTAVSISGAYSVLRAMHLHTYSNISRFLDFPRKALHISVNQPPLLFPPPPLPPLCALKRGGNHLFMTPGIPKPAFLPDSDSQEWGDIIRCTTMS